MVDLFAASNESNDAIVIAARDRGKISIKADSGNISQGLIMNVARKNEAAKIGWTREIINPMESSIARGNNKKPSIEVKRALRPTSIGRKIHGDKSAGLF